LPKEMFPPSRYRSVIREIAVAGMSLMQIVVQQTMIGVIQACYKLSFSKLRAG